MSLDAVGKSKPSFNLVQNEAAERLRESSGASTSRVKIGESSKFSIAAQLFTREIKAGETPKLSPLDKMRFIPLKLTDANNQETWVKLSKESLAKRLNISKQELDKVGDDQGKIQDLMKSKVESSLGDQKEVDKLLAGLKKGLEGGDISKIRDLRSFAKENCSDGELKARILDFCSRMDSIVDEHAGNAEAIKIRGAALATTFENDLWWHKS